MTKEQDNYSAFAEINLSNARSKNESYEDYKKRLKQNEGIQYKVFEQPIEEEKVIQEEVGEAK